MVKKRLRFAFETFKTKHERIGGDLAKFKKELGNVKFDQETFFAEALINCNDKDSGEQFLDFLRDIPNTEVSTYAQVLHHHDAIFKAIIKHMQVPGTRSTVCYLELAMALAHDLRDEFRPYMWPLCDEIMRVMDNAGEDVKVLETAFLTLALMFKQHWRYIIQELRKTFVRFLPLLGHLHKYIRRFTGEAFSFLLRKSSSVSKFIKFACEKAAAVKEYPQRIINGIAILVFNTYRGVNGGFHSCTKQFVTEIVGAILSIESDEVRETGILILEEAMMLTLAYCKMEHLPAVTDPLLNLLESRNNLVGFHEMMRIVMATCKPVKKSRGVQIVFSQHERLFAVVNKLVASPWFRSNEENLELIQEMMAGVFEAEKWNMPLRQLFESVAAASTDSPNALLNLLEGISHMSFFDVYIMPCVAKLAASVLQGSDEPLKRRMISLYASVCADRRPLQEVLERGSRCSPFDCSLHTVTRDFVVDHLSSLSQGIPSENDQLFVASLLTTFPWLHQPSETVKGMNVIVSFLHTLLEMKPPTDHTTMMSLSQLTLLTTVVVYEIDKKVLKNMDEEVWWNFVRSFNTTDSCLRAYRVFVEMRGIRKDGEGLDRAMEILGDCFRSPYLSVRKTALEICAFYEVPLEGSGCTDESGRAVPEPENMFRILANAEARPVNTMVGGKERLKVFRDLLFGAHVKCLPKGRVEACEKVIVSIALSQWFIQFTPIWNGIHELLLSFARGQRVDVFWPLVQNMINRAIQGIRNNIILNATTTLSPLVGDIDPTARTDFGCYIEQLLKFLGRVPDIAERNAKFLSPILLEFFEKDYMLAERRRVITPAELKHVEVEENEKEANAEEEVEKDEVEEDTVEEKETEEVEEENVYVLTKAMSVRILVAFLDMFSLFKSPKSLAMQTQIYALYNDMLVLNTPDLQRSALKCIFTYKFKWLTPYSDLMTSLVGDSLRTELPKLSIGGENSAIEEGHRADLMPLVLRILYGRLCGPVRSLGNASVRPAIVRSLNGCTADELSLFLQMSLLPFRKITGDLSSYDEVNEAFLNPEKCESVNLPSLRSVLGAMEHIIKGIAQQLHVSDRLAIYRLLISSVIIIENICRTETDPLRLKIAKAIRGDSLIRLRQYIFAFADSAWTSEDVKDMLKWVITRFVQVHREGDVVKTVMDMEPVLVTEAIAESRKLFPVLAARITVDGVTTSPLKILVDCLTWEELKKRGIIRKGLIKLFKYEDTSKECFSDIDCIPIERVEGVNYGTSMLVSEIDKLLNYVSDALGGTKNKAVDRDNLEILHGLAPFVNDPSVAACFSSALLNILERKNWRESQSETVLEVTNTLSAILKKLEKPEETFRRITRLFAIFTEHIVRSSLFKIAKALSENERTNTEDVFMLRALCDIESWNMKMTGEPDYDRRAKGYAKLGRLFREGSQKMNLHLLCAISNCSAHTITTIKDIALRAQASINLRELIEYLPKQGYDSLELNQIACQHLIAVCRRGFGNAASEIRDEFVRAMNSLVVSFPDHVHLAELGKLKNVEDPEKDFFENAVHIQQPHRRFAFTYLAEQLTTHQIEVDSYVLYYYLVPLLRHNMLAITEKQSAMSDAALKLLSVILSRSTWKDYRELLNGYLRELAVNLDDEKAIIRVVCEIIGAFHFNVQENVEDTETVNEIVEVEGDAEMETDKDKVGESAVIGEEEEKRDEARMEVDGEDDSEDDDEEKARRKKKLMNAERRRMKKEEQRKKLESGTAIYEQVVQDFLPKLKACVNGKLNPKAAEVHKLAMDSGIKHYQEDDDIRRAPVVLAAVKLLQKMPQSVLDQHLHGFVLKLVQLLVARSDRVREASRQIMIQVVLSLGPFYFPFIIKEMKHVMKRGYQVHVLIYTTHVLLEKIEDQLKPGGLDACLHIIMEMCCDDVFYEVSEEKQIGKIRENVVEAKSRLTMPTMQKVGRLVGSNSLRILLTPVLEVVEQKPTAKAIRDVGELLRNMAIGVTENTEVKPQNLLIFAHQILTEHVAKMTDTHKKNEKKEEIKEGERPKSCLLLPGNPGRMGEMVKHSLRSRSHVFVEYALSLISLSLQKDKFLPTSSSDIGLLDPFVPILATCFSLKYDQVVSLALRCIYHMLPFPLPSLHSNIKSLTERLFIILCDYSALGTAGNKQAILQLNQLLFKTFTGLINICPNTLLDPRHIELLLNYVETDVLDTHKQATAFTLLGTIIEKKFEHPRLPEVMKLIREQAIINEYEHINMQCRTVVAAFVSMHPQSRPPKKEVEWWLDQLEYTYDHGRLSAAEMLNSFFSTMEQSVLDKVCMVAVVKLGARLVNDESPKCRRFVSLALQGLLKGVGQASRNDTFNAAKDWLNTENEGSYAVAAGILLQLSIVEEEQFMERFDETLSLLSDTLSRPGSIDKFAENTILSLLDCITGVLSHTKPEKEHIKEILHKMLATVGPYLRCVQVMEDVRLSSACLLGQILSMCDDSWFSTMSNPSAFDLADWTLFQLRGKKVHAKLAEQAIKNLVYLCNVVSDEQWKEIVERSAKAVHYEIRKHADQTMRRLSLFKFCAALSLRADGDRLSHIVLHFMPLLARELLKKSSQNTDELCTMAIQVGDVLKNRLGEHAYIEQLSKHTREIADKAFERKKTAKELAFIDPAAHIEEKHKKNKKKSELRKRKLDIEKPYRVLKRQHVDVLREQMSDED